MATIAEALALAGQHLQTGQLAAAEQLCRQVLQTDAAQPDALRLLGLLAHKAGKWPEAIASYTAALRLRPDHAEVHNSLGAALAARGQLAEAALSFQQAVRLKPDYAEAYDNLGTVLRLLGRLQEAELSYRQALHHRPHFAQAHGNLGLVLALQARWEEAVASFQAALRYRPDYLEAHVKLGDVLKQMGRLEEAEASYRAALRLRPDLAEVHNALGAVLTERGQHAEALASLREALRLRPDLAAAHHNLGNLFKQMGRAREAEASYRDALRHGPGSPQPLNNLGLVLAEQGRLAEAAASLEEALRLRPDYAEAHANLGDVLKTMGRLTEAEARYREALRLRPRFPHVHNNLGILLHAQGRSTEALACYEEALHLKPDFAEAHNNRGNALKDMGEFGEAEASYREAVRLRPDKAEFHNNLGLVLAALGHVPAALVCHRMAASLSPESHAIRSNVLLTLQYLVGADPETTFGEHVRWGQQFEGRGARDEGREVRASSLAPRPSPLVLRDPQRRLRLGYVSGDFREHVQGHYSENVITAHDRTQFEIFCYSNLHKEDERTRRIQAAANHWRSIVPLSDAEAAKQIRQDQVDILIDLAGHTAHNRLGVFARKPAPIQVTHFGYAASTGLTAMDYRLTDAYCDPPGWTERFHCEKLVRLPEQQWCYASGPCPEVEASPAQRAGEVTFGSFNNLIKVTEDMIGLWAQVLEALPASRMLVQAGGGSAGDARVLDLFRSRGIARERLTLVGKKPRTAYFGLYHGVDICLDTFPFSGCNTTADALWMGVPVITLAGRTWASRQGVGILTQVGLEDLVTESPAAYVQAAICLARDLPRLRELRGQLRERLRRTLGDVARFTRQLEAAYRQMWQTYCGQASG